MANSSALTVSTIIPVYNRLEQGMRAFRSVLSQKGLPESWSHQIVVVNDGSDQDLTALKELVESSEQSWLEIPHAGVSAARNAGISHSCGEWICLLDSDDYWEPDKLGKQLHYHQSAPERLISQTAEQWVRNGKPFYSSKVPVQPEGDAFAACASACCVSSSSVMFHRTIWETYGPFDEQLLSCEDYELYLKIAASEPIGLLSEKLVVKHGGHADQLSQKYRAMDRFRVYSLIKLMVEHPQLSVEKQEVLREALLQKVSVLIAGAKKRGFKGLALYQEVEGFASGQNASPPEGWRSLARPVEC